MFYTYLSTDSQRSDGKINVPANKPTKLDRFPHTVSYLTKACVVFVMRGEYQLDILLCDVCIISDIIEFYHWFFHVLCLKVVIVFIE